jgi:hypothetical protein
MKPLVDNVCFIMLDLCMFVFSCQFIRVIAPLFGLYRIVNYLANDPKRPVQQGTTNLTFFLENKEYRPFDGCKIEI